MPNPGHTLVLAMCQAPSASRDAALCTIAKRERAIRKVSCPSPVAAQNRGAVRKFAPKRRTSGREN